MDDLPATSRPLQGRPSPIRRSSSSPVGAILPLRSGRQPISMSGPGTRPTGGAVGCQSPNYFFVSSPPSNPELGPLKGSLVAVCPRPDSPPPTSLSELRVPRSARERGGERDTGLGKQRVSGGARARGPRWPFPGVISRVQFVPAASSPPPPTPWGVLRVQSDRP